MSGAQARNTATYLYCLVQSAEPPQAGPAPLGLPGLSEPRLLPAGDGVWLAVADAPLPEYGAESIQEHLQDLDWVSSRALAHEAVVEHFGRGGTVVPFKLFTLFSSDERALAHIRADRERLDHVFKRIAGCQEWGVRVRFDESRAREVLAREAGEPASASGTAFLLRKKTERDASRTLAARLRSEMGEVFSDLAGQAADARRRDPVAPLLLDGAFLVPADLAGEFERTVGRWAERLAGQACEMTLTGPWPPYNFIDTSSNTGEFQ